MTAFAWHVFQSTLFAAAIGLLSFAFRRERAATRHALWLAASVKFLLPFSLLVSLSARIPTHAARAVPPPEMTFVMSDPALPPARPSFAAPHAGAAGWLPMAAWTVYLVGAAAFLLRWRMRWSRAAAALRDAAPLPAPAPPRVTTLCTPSVHEPCAFGIFRPVLLLPDGIQERLSAPQLEAILAHELCHLRRRDNLTGAIHMLVECLFWFHPLVWWIGARLVEERELACDEEVLGLGADPVLYAESILKVCEFCLQPPLPCISGITGADLLRRIEAIVSARRIQPLRGAKKLLLATGAAAVFAAPIAVGLARLSAQPQPRTAPPQSFEVVSVKPVAQTWLQIAPQRLGGRIRWQTDLTYIIAYAYHLEGWRISGPVPGSDHIYAVDATTSESASEDQVRLMFQSILADRFQMTAHRVVKEVEGYALTVAKNGPRIKDASGSAEPVALPEWFRTRGVPAADLEGKIVATVEAPGVAAITGRGVSMLQLAAAIQRVLRVSVLDQTGLTGKYYFGLEFAQEDHPADVDLPTIFAAVQETLGLKLEKQKGPVEMLVVDRISATPTEN